MKRIFLILSMVSAAIFSCSDSEDAITPSEFPAGDVANIETALNQGTKKYNDVIQSFYDDKGSVLLYDFPYNAPNYMGGNYQIEDMLHYTEAQEDYVGYLLNFYTQIATPWGGSWEKDFFPRNVFFVDSLYTVSTTGYKTLRTLMGTNVSITMSGASEVKRDEFLAHTYYDITDEEQLKALTSLSSFNAKKRVRVKFRYDLTWAKFSARIDAGEIEIPQAFKDMVSQTINAEEYNALPRYTARQTYLGELGLLNFSDNFANKLKDYYEVKEMGSGYARYYNLVNGKPIEEKLDEYILTQFKYYVQYLFDSGIEYALNSTKHTYIKTYKYPKEVLQMIIDESVNFADVDFAKLLSEEAITIPEDFM